MPDLAVILVDPLYAGNVGHVARSMMNFGTTDLRIVQGTRLTEEGRDRAVHAQAVLDDARRVDTLDEAAEGCDLLVGFTARLTEGEEKYRRNPLDLRDWAPDIAGHPGRIGLVFGREDRGLTNNEAGRCDVLVTIPTSDQYRSLNLSHAVTVALWDIYAEAEHGRVKEYTPASKEQLDRLIARFGQVMALSDFPEHKRQTVLTMIRRLIGRAHPTQWELHTFMGVLRDNLYHLGVRRDKAEGELGLEDRKQVDLDLMDPGVPDDEGTSGVEDSGAQPGAEMERDAVKGEGTGAKPAPAPGRP